MFAVVKTGGKQYRVTEGAIFAVEKLEGKAGDKLMLSDVLALGGDAPKLGIPLIEGAAVNVEILEQKKTDKVIVFKKKRRQNYRRKNGHRQQQTVLKVTGIVASGAKAPEKAAAAPKKAPAAKPAADKAAAKPAAAKKAAPAKKATKE